MEELDRRMDDSDPLLLDGIDAAAVVVVLLLLRREGRFIAPLGRFNPPCCSPDCFVRGRFNVGRNVVVIDDDSSKRLGFFVSEEDPFFEGTTTPVVREESVRPTTGRAA